MGQNKKKDPRALVTEPLTFVHYTAHSIVGLHCLLFFGARRLSSGNIECNESGEAPQHSYS
jgi:hypothetical protein